MAHKLSIIIPVFNEEVTVVDLLEKVKDCNLSIEKEIIIVNDGSTDSSGDLIKRWCNENLNSTTLKYIEKANGGKGDAVRCGIMESTGDIVIIQDADLEYDPNDYEACIGPICAKECDVVYGSRELMANAKRLHSSLSFFLGGLLLTGWMNLLYGAHLTDEPTCYKCFDGDLIRNLSFRGNKFDWEPEITAKLLRLDFEIREVPIAYFPRKVCDGKKIRWSDGVSALWTAFYWRFATIEPVKKN